MTTLVTGGSGFLGTHLVAELRRRGTPVRLFAQRAPAGADVVAGSVTSAADCARAVAGVDQIYHLAGFVSRKREDGHRMFEVHVEGTRLLCEAAKAAGVRRIVVVSTSGTIAVSTRPDDKPDEDSDPPVELIGRWPYYASKLYQEQAARRACAGGPELVIVNPSLLLGPGDDRLSSTRDVVQFLGREIPLCPPGGLNFVDARDVAAALPAAMERGRPGERYLMGGHNVSFAEYFGRLERLSKVPAPKLAPKGRWTVQATEVQAALWRALGRRPPLEPDAVDMARHYWYFDSVKAREELGFTAREATETLHDTIRYLRERVLGRPAVTSAA